MDVRVSRCLISVNFQSAEGGHASPLEAWDAARNVLVNASVVHAEVSLESLFMAGSVVLGEDVLEREIAHCEY